MCEACAAPGETNVPARRRRVWELAGGWHCAVIGTCLTLADLRALARKLDVRTMPGFSVDYQLHGCFVKEAEKPGKPAKLLNKLLDRRHAGAIRKAKTMKTEAELDALWQDALESGDIPGPYWAILSHPAAGKELCERMFADVHMLSHMVGASNRADISRLRQMEEETLALEAKLAKRRGQYRERLAAKNREIAEWREKWRRGMSRRARLEGLAAPALGAGESGPATDWQGEIRRLESERGETQETLRRHQRRLAELEATVRLLQDENRTLEEALTRDEEPGPETCPFDLGGRCLLYVGGRQQTVHHLRALVEEWNGRFLHHDGGIERSIDELASSVTKADAVVFPTDCVSHSAANKVKRLCHQSMKPFVPLRSSGVASFVAGVRDGFDGIVVPRQRD